MNRLTTSLTGPMKRGISAVCGRVDVSVAEILCLTAGAVCIWWIIWLIRDLITQKEHLLTVGKYVLFMLCAVLTVYDGFCLLWGADYYTDSFSQRSGIYETAGTSEQLEQLTAKYAQALAAYADTVPRGKNGLCTIDRQEIIEKATAEYAGLSDEFPFLQYSMQKPKGFTCSSALSAMEFTGFFFPFTGETNLNLDSPACFLPSTALHELSHQQGIASEQACNFLAIIGCIRSHEPTYRYSGYLLGFLYLSNALYRVSPDRWEAVVNSLPLTVRLDLQNNNDYWAAHQSIVSKAWSDLYDRFLKSYGTADGIASYGTVVNLLISYEYQ